MKRYGKALLVLMLGLVAAVLLALPLIRAGLHKLDLARYPQKYQELVEQYALENQIDPLVIYSVIRTESGFDSKAESNVGARGLMQITEETFWWIKSKIAPKEELEFEDLYDPETNIRFGSYYFAACLSRYENDLATAAAAYHSGWGTVDGLLEQEAYSADGEILHTFPYEQMKLYVYKITHAFQKYQTLYSSVEIEG